MIYKEDGSTFDNSNKETDEALEWFKANLYLVNDVLHWGKSTGNRERSSAYLFKPSGCISSRGYIQVRKGKQKFMAHRIIWALHNGKWPTSGIDHINGDTLDNSIGNLRVATQFKNSKNASKYPRLENWIATGVQRSGSKWYACAQVDKKSKYIGTFNCHTSAMIARKLFNKENGFTKRHGE